MMSESPVLKTSLYVKLAEVMALAGRIEKRGENTFHHYKYAMESDIVEAVRMGLAERHVMLVPSVRQVIREGTLTTALMSFQFTDGETGESATFDWAGTGDDKGDKGLYKAMTGALKYFLLKTFLLPTGDDPEADAETDKRAAGATQQRKPSQQRGSLPAPIMVCLRCSAQAEPGSDYCATCNRLHADRLADDALAAAGLKPPPYPTDVAVVRAPPTDAAAERKRLFAMLRDYGWEMGDAGRPERLKLYTRVLGREITEAAAKKLTAQDWRKIADTIEADNEPPADDTPPPGLAL